MQWVPSNSLMKRTGDILVTHCRKFSDSFVLIQVKGPSSNVSFLRHISLAMARAGDLTQAFPSPGSHAREISGGISVSRPHHVESDRNTRPFHGSVNIYALPSESRTWALIKEYFQKTGQLLPFVHEESFCTAYFEMKKKNFTRVRRTWLGLLNIILACATTLHVDAETTTEKRIEESDLYYQRANGLCDKESRRNISVELGMSFGSLAILLVAQTNCLVSAISTHIGTVSTKYPEICAGLDRSWLGYYHGISAGTPISQDKQRLPTVGVRGKKARVVWMCIVGPVSRYSFDAEYSGLTYDRVAGL